MKILVVGGVYGLLLSRQEFEDLVETVEAYCIGDTSPSVEPSPEIREFYPTERFTPPVDERYWRLHAALANRKSRGAEAAETSETGG